MLTLGIADNHDAGAALANEHGLIAAVGQERVDRIKNSGAFPWGAIDAVLDIAGVREADIGRVVVGSGFTPSFLLRLLPGFHKSKKEESSQFSPTLNGYIVYQSILQRAGLAGAEVAACKAVLRHRLKGRHFADAELILMDHHTAHAEAAYRTQGRDRVLVFTLDAMGDGVSVTVSQGAGGTLERVFSQSGFAGINTYYSRVTEWLGYRPNRHEGKITGLAAAAPPPPALVEHFSKILYVKDMGFNRLPYWTRQSKDDSFYSELNNWSSAQVASALQKNLEDAVSTFIDAWVKRLGLRHIALAGGIFANVKLNQRIAELESVQSLWVTPHMGDGGLPTGAALFGANAPPATTKTRLLGHSFSSSDISRAIGRAKLSKTKPRDIERSIAKHLANGKVVAHFDGKMEWGPRALGARSVLFRPDDPSVNDWLNKRLGRTEFMPFAPMVLAEDAPELFIGLEKAAESAKFMTVCFDCTDKMKELCPGVVHTDGTARPQIIHQSENPRIHKIISEFKALTGLPATVNTSFNIHEEPIVCSPSDAIRAFCHGKLDLLAIGEWIVSAKG
jgi:carbamoyltransferase